jgi:hypothetical protein
MFASILKIFGCFADLGVLNKDPSVWLGGARPANTCILLSFLRMSNVFVGEPTNESMFVSILKWML